MKSKFFLSSLAVASAAVFSFSGGALAQTGTSGAAVTTAPVAAASNQSPTDALITTQVKSELANTKDIADARIAVSTEDGVVSLSGTLANKLEVQKAEAAAKSVKGVKKVNVSNLEVNTNAPASDAAHSSSAGEAVTDAWITTKVKAELATTKDVASMDVSVTTVDGVVTLTGVLPNAQEVEKARAAAQAVQGVKQVDATGMKAKD